MVVWREYMGRALPVSGSVYVRTASFQRGWLSPLGGSVTACWCTKEGYGRAWAAIVHSAAQREKVRSRAMALQYAADWTLLREARGVTRYAVRALKRAVESVGRVRTAGDHTVVKQMAG